MSVAKINNVMDGGTRPNDVNPSKVVDPKYQIYMGQSSVEFENYAIPIYGWTKLALRCSRSACVNGYAFILSDGTITTYQSVPATDTWGSYVDIPSDALQLIIKMNKGSGACRLFYSLTN